MKKGFVIFLRWLITLSVIGVLAYLIWYFLLNRDNRSYVEPLNPVKVERPVKSTLEQTLTLSGYVQASAMIPVVPFVSGTVKEYKSDVGDYVEKDQLLAIVDPEPYKLQLDQAEAVYLASKSTFERLTNLYEIGATTKQSYEEAKAQYDAYKAQYELAKVQLGYTEVLAPVSGTVLMKNSAVGSVASPQDYIYIIADLNELEISLNVPESYFDVINDNKDNIKAEIIRDETKAQGMIKSISPYVSPESKTFKLILTLSSNVEKFRPGMYVKVNLVYRTYDDVYLLKSSIINTDGSLYFYNMSDSSVSYFNFIPEIYNNEYFAVPEDFSEYMFVVEGQSNLLDGMKVRVI